MQKKKSSELLEKTQKDIDERRKEFLKAQQLLLRQRNPFNN